MPKLTNNNWKWLAFTLLLIVLPVSAQNWSGKLHDGSQIEIDPESHRAIQSDGNGGQQLWDGVHRTDDGGVLIIKDGVVISRPDNTAPTLVEQNDERRSGAPSTCVELAVKVCGFYGECNSAESCPAARQLVKLEQDEAWQSRGKSTQQTAQQCRTALENESYFTRCEKTLTLKKPTPCGQLVTHVCGIQQDCNESDACIAAQQLFNMEMDERRGTRDPERATPTSHLCLEAVTDSGYFSQCAY